MRRSLSVAVKFEEVMNVKRTGRSAIFSAENEPASQPLPWVAAVPVILLVSLGLWVLVWRLAADLYGLVF
jgi:hypothetical protein